MWKRNNGKGETNVLQNRFTRYLVTAVKRQKVSYVRSRRQLSGIERPLEMQENQLLFQTEPDMLENLPLSQKLENQKLQSAIKEMKEKERYIFLERVLSDKNFSELSAELGIGYKGVATAYYRAVQKIKEYMKETEKNEF